MHATLCKMAARECTHTPAYKKPPNDRACKDPKRSRTGGGARGEGEGGGGGGLFGAGGKGDGGGGE